MTIVYRSIWEDSRSDIHEQARDIFVRWLAQKNIRTSLPTEGSVDDGDIRLTHELSDTESGTAHRLVLAEDRPTTSMDYWRTTLTTISIDGQRWVWVDLEWVSDMNFDKSPNFMRPGLIPNLLEGGHGRVGDIRLSSDAGHYEASQVEELGDLILDRTRALPVVVFTHDRAVATEQVEAAASSAAKVLAGVGFVCTVTPSAMVRLNQQLGQGLHVYGGAARIFLPGTRQPGDRPGRHYYILRDKVIGSRKATNTILTERIYPLAAAARPPLAYRQLLHGTFGSQQGVDQQLRLAEELLRDSEEEARALREERDELEARLYATEDLLDGREQRADYFEGRARYLEQQLIRAGASSDTVFAVEPINVDDITSLQDAVIKALDLEHLVIPESAYADIDSLDRDPKAKTYGRKAFRSLLALNLYASKLHSGELTMSLKSALEDGRLEDSGAQPKWFAARESQSTDTNDRYRALRTFPVPTEVNPTGSVYMDAHIKLVEGGGVAPRIHYHDDLRGTTGKFHIGWIGPHLDNASKN